MQEKERRVYVVIDDDPTGGQTVHDVPVLLKWNQEILEKYLMQRPKMLYIMTNSRCFNQEDAVMLQHQLMKQLIAAAKETGVSLSVISRGDSTLRGHFPAETDVIGSYVSTTPIPVLIPCFPEGKRFTEGDIHYLISEGNTVPVGESEFAKDKTFGYRNSDLKQYIEEKTGGRIHAPEVGSVSLEMVDQKQKEEICRIMENPDYKAIIVNAKTYEHLVCFKDAYEMLENKERFVFRTAAAWPKVIGEITDIPYLKADKVYDKAIKHGGLVVMGSHVKQSSRQLEILKQRLPELEYLELNQHLVLDEEAFEKETDRISKMARKAIADGRTAVIYTKRERFDVKNGNEEDNLCITQKIAEGITRTVRRISVCPRYVITKGGITSSDVVKNAFEAGAAVIMGQIMEGIPVWRLEKDARYPGMPVVIFPGNVGDKTALADITEELEYQYGST